MSESMRQFRGSFHEWLAGSGASQMPSGRWTLDLNTLKRAIIELLREAATDPAVILPLTVTPLRRDTAAEAVWAQMTDAASCTIGGDPHPVPGNDVQFGVDPDRSIYHVIRLTYSHNDRGVISLTDGTHYYDLPLDLAHAAGLTVVRAGL